MSSLSGKVGLEIHVYLDTNEKLFCRCKASKEKGLKPNIYVCPVCTGQPGAKPMLPNGEAVKKGVQIGLMLNCKINSSFYWMRKHYDWPDLPKGYQNTISGAYAIPVGVKGEFSGIRINSMHLEEDPAAWDPKTGCIDYNRSGLPLVEIVTEPDFKTSEEVYLWVKRLVHSLSYLKAVDKNAGIKADVNVSIPNKTERVEVKNVNSILNMKKTVDFEIARQLKEGSVRETRRWDAVKNKTMHMRSKEEAQDYRFIEDPDLVSISLDNKFIEGLKEGLPESPDVKLNKLIKEFKIGKQDAQVLSKNLEIAEFFESVVKKVDGKFALSWVTVELLRVLNYNKKSLDEVEIKVEDFVKLLKLVKSGKITELQGKQILNKFVPQSFDPSDSKGKIEDSSELKKIIEKIISENKKAVSDFKTGDSKALNFLMGKVMHATERRADFKVAKDLLEKLLK